MKKTMIIIAAGWILAQNIPALFAGDFYLEHSTYLGGSMAERSEDIALDQAGCIYLAGYTYSPDFPTFNPYQASFASESIEDSDALIVKFASDGSSLLYSSYLGGEANDCAKAMAVGLDNCVYLTGYTSSYDFPTINPYQASGYGAFVAKLSSTGTSLIFSTYVGSSMHGYDIVVNTSNCSYITGSVWQGGLPVKNPYQSSAGGWQDAFVTKFSSSGSSLIYSTYWGGQSMEEGHGIALDSAENMYITGYTQSFNFITFNPYQASYAGGTGDAFITKLSSSGSQVIFSTYLGGSDHDNYSCFYGYGKIAVDSAQCAYAIGCTASPDFPTQNAYQSSYSGGLGDCYYAGDAFITKLSSTGSSVVYSTYLGGDHTDHAYAIAIGSDSSAYITGKSYSSNFPTYNPYQASRAGQADIFLAGFSSNGSSLIFSTYFGGSEMDYGYGLAISANSFYISGYTESLDFPTLNPYQPSYAGGSYPDKGDICLLRLRWVPSPTPTSTSTPSPSPTPSPTPEGYKTPTPEPSATPSASTSPTPCATPSIEPSATSSPRSTATPSPSPSCGPSIVPYRIMISSGDYDGDGAAEVAIYRPSAGLWSVRGITRLYFGNSSDQPAPGDYDGDGTSEISIFRASAGLWSISGFTRAYFGGAEDRSVPADYDGDGSCDIGIFRENGGVWSIRSLTRFYFGATNDWPIPGDYANDGTAEAGLYRVSSGQWLIRDITRFYFGGATDWPVPGTYFGTGVRAFGIFKACSGMWAFRDVTRIYFGNCFDYPRPGDFNGDGTDDFGVFRDSAGMWSVRNLTRVYFGATGDIPVTR